MSRTKGAKDKQPRKKTGSSSKPKNKVVIARKPSNGKSGFTVKRVESV